ncbi:MAG: hypothetical protein QOI26_1552 [Pseudonocardiales bacterium]|nr:hypothetical protein [Pseudonocardiales bacterium]
MLLDRQGALAGLLLSVAVAGCGASDNGAAPQASTSPPAASSSSISTSAQQSSSPLGSAPASTTPAAPPSSAISIPASLCSGADIAQNAADAYMGALSAGNAKQAMACVLPHTVPAALTRSLLAKDGTTAVYLPRDGVDGPSVFGYRGSGKLIDVTVTKQRDGQFWVTQVAVRSG